MQALAFDRYVIAKERLADCLLESGAIFDQMWSETVGGHTTPDWSRWLDLEARNELLNVTVRDADEAAAMVGYVRMYLLTSITTGRRHAEEDMVYIAPRCRSLDLAHRLHAYVEEACAEAGYRDLWATVPINSGQERYLRRHGYVPRTARFNKVI